MVAWFISVHPGVVGIRLVHWGVPSALIVVRSRGHEVHLGPLGSLGFALGVVGLIKGRCVY